MPETIKAYDAADYLRDEADVAAYLEAATEHQDAATLMMALATVARTRNLTHLAQSIGITREGLYKALGPNGNPRLANVMKLAGALGFELVLRRKPAA